MIRHAAIAILPLVLTACNASNGKSADGESDPVQATASDELPFQATEITQFEEPWAMTFLPNGDMLVTEKGGKIFVATQSGTKTPVTGAPEVDYGGQGGLGDIVLSPDFEDTDMVYLSWAEAGSGDTRGAAVGRAKLVKNDAAGTYSLENMEVVWRQDPKVSGKGHYSHRIVFSPDGKYMFIASGDRQKMQPAQDMSGNLGKIVRLFPDGSVPKDNPFYDKGGVTAQIWTLGHRNILGIDFNESGELWAQEMGPAAGDELNLIKKGQNYGWPLVSEGEHYNGDKIPAHSTRPDLAAPKVAWAPVTIAPSGLVFYTADAFPQWKGSAFIGGLKSKALIRISFDGNTAKEAERFDMSDRIREVEQGPDGSLWLLEDGESGKLWKLSPNR